MDISAAALAQQAQQEDAQRLAVPGRIVGDALAQDDQSMCLEEAYGAGAGSADYELRVAQFTAELAGDGLPPQLTMNRGADFLQQGMLPDIQRLWRSCDSQLVLWKYADPRIPELTEYCGVTQQIVTVATARPKHFVSGVDHFLVISTPVEISLHALRFAPGSDHLLPPIRSQHAVATDDVVVGAIACDSGSGRIFLGGNDGCVHEFQYFDDEARWFGRPKKCRKSAVNWTLQSQMPTILQRVWVSLFGPSEAITQLVVDSSRGLLFALSSLSTITVFQIPPNRRDSSGNLEEPPLVLLCSITQTAIAAEVGRIKDRLFPGLRPANSRGFSFGAFPSATGSTSAPRLIKLLPIAKAHGGNIIACAFAEDGTRVFIRGNFRKEASASIGVGQATDAYSAASAGSQGISRGITITSLAVHHARFLDAAAPKDLRVRDAFIADGIVLLLCRLSGSAMPVQGGVDPDRVGEAAVSEDAVLALSVDLRAVAQRQGRNRSPWLGANSGLAEHVDVIRLAGQGDTRHQTGDIIGIAPLASSLPRPLQTLYNSSPGNGLVLPVAGLSELAKQQLLPAPRFMLVSTLGAHVLKKIQPLDVFQERLLLGDLNLLQDFALQYTVEQTCALCFQILTQAVTRPLTQKPSGSSMTGGRRSSQSMSSGGLVSQLDDRRSSMIPSLMGTSQYQDPCEELLLYRAEQLLLAPQLSMQMGFVQVLPSVEPQSQTWAQGSQLGQAVQLRSTASLSGRLRGLYLYLSRLLRPLWLAPIMLVTWAPPQGSKAGHTKRRRDEWWPPPPDPPPVAKGAQWQCSFSRAQRMHVCGQLTMLGKTLDLCLPRLVPEDPPFQLASPANRQYSPTQEEAAAAGGAMKLIQTVLEGLNFLELLSGCTDALSTALCPAEVLHRFSELTFRDLVCSPEARRILQQLMRSGIVACRQLHSQCPSLFSAADLEVQEAYQLLKVVQESIASTASTGSTLDLARLSGLMQRALRTLQQHASRVDLPEAADRLRAVGACKPLIALCSSVARARDPRDEAMRPQDPANPRIQQLHYARLECYQVVLELLEDFLSFARKHGMTQSPASLLQTSLPFAGATVRGNAELPELLPARVQEKDSVTILHALLRHCLEAPQYQADELFHFCILKWMMQTGLPPFQYKSPYLKNFLEVHARDQPELLCRYLQHNGRWAEACDAYCSLAKGAADGSGRSVQDRLVALQNAATCARMPGSSRRVEPILRMMAELNPQQEDFAKAQ
eukprot:TRINITY_DN91959_c0_g1_i1.p1 TRINITY_DN91959_c0_g1~~TRINITY_DN91959_c0_g1_i1.p1  ORF type:complete len:1257 (+),score=220.30 TRINITY_DN91959_c0_g1_i1:54-3773(+)